MSNNRLFFQDYLFENLPVDEHDIPQVKVQYGDDIEEGCKTISLDRLCKMNHLKEWETLYKSIRGKKVVIVDDVEIKNEELQKYKFFLISTYYFNISNRCNSCIVVKLK